MSHQLEMVNGQASMVYAGEVPWHGLGKLIPPDLSPEQVLKTAGLDWSVKKEPMYRANGDMIENRKLLVRESDNKIFDIVSDSWCPLQNIDAFKFFDEFVEQGDMEMHTAGALKGGSVVWALAKVKESFTLFKDDHVESYLLFTNPHRYSSSIDVRFTPTRVVCNNTLTAALEEKTSMKFTQSHRVAFDSNLVKQVLALSSVNMRDYEEKANILASKVVKLDDVKQYLNTLFPNSSQDEEKRKQLSRNAIQVLDLIDKQPGAQYGEGTWWPIFNAVTYFTDHVQGRDNERRVASMWYGANKQLKQQAMKLALAA